MNWAAKIREYVWELIQQYMADKRMWADVAKVVSVDEDKRICEVAPLSGDSERSARLQATLEISEGVYVKPKVDSFVCISYLSNERAVVVNYSEIESIETTTNGGMSIKLDDKVEVSNNSESLKAILDDILAEIKLITVPTPAGTSGTPLNFAQFDALIQRIDNLMK